MAETERNTTKNKHRYQLIAQRFTLPHGLRVLAIRDNKNDIIIHTAAALVFRDDEMLGDMSPQDIRRIGYIFACDFETMGKNTNKADFSDLSCSHSGVCM